MNNAALWQQKHTFVLGIHNCTPPPGSCRLNLALPVGGIRPAQKEFRPLFISTHFSPSDSFSCSSITNKPTSSKSNTSILFQSFCSRQWCLVPHRWGYICSVSASRNKHNAFTLLSCNKHALAHRDVCVYCCLSLRPWGDASSGNHRPHSHAAHERHRWAQTSLYYFYFKAGKEINSFLNSCMFTGSAYTFPSASSNVLYLLFLSAKILDGGIQSSGIQFNMWEGYLGKETVRTWRK